MNRYRERGSISIFLAITLLAIIVLFGVFIDAVRVNCARNDATRAADMAAVSALASYDTELRRDYGIFAVSVGSLNDGSVEEYIERNLVVDEGEEGDANTTRLFEYEVEGSAVIPTLPLSAVDVVDRQIIEFMKFRAPLSLVSGVVQKLRAATETTKIAEPLKKKIDIDKRLESVGKEQLELAKRMFGVSAVYGASGSSKTKGYEKTVNGYLSDSFKADAVEPIVDAYAQCVEIRAYIRESEKEAKEKDEPKPDLSADKSALAEIMMNLVRETDKIEDALDKYIDANEKALDCVAKLSGQTVEITPMLDDLDAGIGDLVDLESAKDIAKELDKGVKQSREWLMTEEEAAALSGPLIENVAVLRAEKASLLELFKKLLSDSSTDSRVLESEIKSKLTTQPPGYNDKINFEIDAAYSELTAPDPRQAALDAAGTFMNDTGLDNKDPSVELGIRMKNLPSLHIMKGSGETASGETVSGETGAETQTDAEVDAADKYADNPGKSLQKEMDLQDTKSEFAGNKLNALSAIGDLALFLGASGRDQLYRAEYALSVFDNAIGEPYMWATDSLVKRDGFYKAEIEYLLHGQAKQSTNILITKAQIFGLRVALNLVHVYSDSDKVQLSKGVAMAVVGGWCAPLAPVAQALIMTGWSAIEAYRDVDDLYNGLAVPLIKTKSDWKSDIGLKSAAKSAVGAASGAAGGTGGKTQMSIPAKLTQFSYLDYLRINLILMRKEKFVGRVLDLIEINSKKEGGAFKAMEMYCGARVELDLSINDLFVSSALAPRMATRVSGRRKVSAVVERDLF